MAGLPQPSQKHFDTRVWQALAGFSPAQPVFVESESARIGALRVPEPLLVRMRAHPLPEARQYAELMLQELRKVIPSFLRRVDIAERGGRWRAVHPGTGKPIGWPRELRCSLISTHLLQVSDAARRCARFPRP